MLPIRLGRDARTLLLAALVAPVLPAHAQALATGGAVSSSPSSQGPVLPSTRGFNLSLASTSQRDSNSGWSSLLTPAVAYRVDNRWTLGASFPVFATVNAYQQTAPARGTTPATYGFVNHTFLPGDANAGVQFVTHPAGFEDTLGATIGIPTGDPALGLGAGKTTFEIATDIDHSIGDYITPEFELALDNSPNITMLRLRKSYIATGLSAHLQGGLGISLPRRINLSLDGYDDLPLGSQTVTGKKKNKAAAAQSDDARDNGIMSTLDIPVSGHITASAFFNRSFYDATDIAGVTLNFVLRAPHRDAAE